MHDALEGNEIQRLKRVELLEKWIAEQSDFSHEPTGIRLF